MIMVWFAAEKCAYSNNSIGKQEASEKGKTGTKSGSDVKVFTGSQVCVMYCGVRGL
jgi:hypothetical protein